MYNFKEEFRKKLIQIGIKKGCTLIVNIDLLKIIIFLKKKKINLNLNDLIETLKNAVGDNGNLIFYSFFWDFFKTRLFDHKHSKSASGSLSNFLLKDKNFIRTKHPVYSLLAWGKDKKKISMLNHSNSFGKNSPFGYLIKKKSKLLFMNIDFKMTGFPFFHVAEQEVGVYYRYFKSFSGKIIENNKKKNISFKMYVRKKNYKILTYYSNETIKILKKLNSYKTKKCFGSYMNLIDLPELYKLTINQLKIEKKMLLRKESNKI